ncbi:MAG: hypothetical protein E7118_06695 [Bacteroidales bacterium]|nr:hypothetical protein [Bacteroidales bacterium]
MKAYNTFNFNRFGKFLASDLRHCLANYGLSMLLMSMMGLIIYIGTVTMGLVFNGVWDGPGVGFRLTVFIITMFVLMTSMPVKCYGGLTDKKTGSAWLMLPVSRLEKYLSMIINTVFIIPLATGSVYVLVDSLLCGLDPTCGAGIVTETKAFLVNMVSESFATEADMISMPSLGTFAHQVSNPLLYIDDIIMISLIFLLGAVCFKSGKTVKTFFAIFAYSIAFSFISVPVISHYIGGIMENINMLDQTAFIEDMFNSWIFRHAALVDTINDTVVNLALMAGIWFRIKTLKH